MKMQEIISDNVDLAQMLNLANDTKKVKVITIQISIIHLKWLIS